jgi:hypothetical protein
MDFLGYRPSIGELLAAFVLAMLAERAWRIFSRTWDFVLDLIAASSSKLRIRRIKKLERKIEMIKRYAANDRAVLLRFIKRLTGIVVLFGLFGIVDITRIKMELSIDLDRIISFLHIPPLPIWSSMLIGDITPDTLYYDSIGYMIVLVTNIALLLAISYRALSTLREIDDFADVPKATKALEARISALSAKGAKSEM